MSLTSKALWIIERNRCRPFTLGDVAAACTVSRYHLAHAFAASTGVPVMHYVRDRNLTEAARALADGAPDILDLALDAGYGSHEAFSRAFRAKFGTTPETVRCTKTTENLPMTTAMKAPNIPDVTLAVPRIEDAGPMRLVGLPARYATATTQAIPAQWQAFMAVYDDIPAKTAAAPFGVYRNMDDYGAFEHVCAVAVTAVPKLPRGLIELRIPKQTYLVFQHLDHAAALGATYAAIWNDWLAASPYQAANGPSLERCLDGFSPRTGLGGMGIGIPIEAD